MGNGEAYLANGLAVGDGVGGLRLLVAGFEVVGNQGGTEGFDHQVVVVERSDDDAGVDAVEGGGDVRGRHFGGLEGLKVFWYWSWLCWCG
jgi:hypothetical protein